MEVTVRALRSRAGSVQGAQGVALQRYTEVAVIVTGNVHAKAEDAAVSME
jgi:hypothetical protein